MSSQFHDQLDHLKQLNLAIRRGLEQAEWQIGAAKEQLAQLSATGLLSDRIVLGDLILQRAYSAHYASLPSGQVLQAALAIPGGFGAVFWDSEEYLALQQDPDLESEALFHFVFFDRCEPAIKALLVSQIEPLLGQLLRRIAAL